MSHPTFLWSSAMALLGSITLVFVIAAPLVSALSVTPITVILPRDCNNSEFYDSAQLKCKPCSPTINGYLAIGPRDANGSLIGPTEVRLNQFECTCAPGHYKRYEPNDILSFKCSPCPDRSVVSLDGLSCASCQGRYDSLTCTCPTGTLIEELEGGKLIQRCSSCVSFTRKVKEQDSNACVPCHPTFIQDMANHSITGKCECPREMYREIGGLCIPKNDLTPEKPGVFFVSVEGVLKRSKFLSDNLQAASFSCRHLGNRTSCQLLANLCVLIHYSFADTLSIDLSNACMEYRKLMSGSSQINQNVWPEKGPWLYYDSDGTGTELKRTNVPNKFKVKSTVKIMAFRFNGLGKLVDASVLDPRELQICPDTLQSSRIGMTFGTNVYHECILPAADIWNSTKKTPEETLFYDLYLLDEESNSMYPIPVLNYNLEKNGRKINSLDSGSGQHDGKLQLVRRFFVRDGISSSGVVRVLDSVDLDFNLRESDGSGSVFPPLVTVSYIDITEEDVQDGKMVYTSFRVTYWIGQRQVERDVSITMSVLSSVAVVWSLLKTWTWSKRDGRFGVDLPILGKFIIISIGYIANIFLIVSVGCCINWFFLFKKQSVLHTLLPTPDQEYSTVWIYLIIALPLKTIQVIHDLVIMCTADVFIIDWERPRSRQQEWPQLSVIRAAQSKSALEGSMSWRDQKDSQHAQSEDGDRDSSIKDKSSTTGTSSRPQSRVKSAPPLPTPQRPGVSVWRSLFVANEWLELFSYRRISPGVHFILLIFCMKVLGFEDMVKYTPIVSTSAAREEDREALRHVPDSLSCRIAVGTLIYGILIFLQYIYKAVIYERYIKDKLKEFVDFASVANVSVFVWLHSRYGFYIHGRSPHGRAEVDMKQMHLLLQREEEDLCSRRGLVPNTDQQTFEMSLPPGMFDHYVRMRNLMGIISTTGGGSGSIGGQGTGATGQGSNVVKRHLGRLLTKTDVDKILPAYWMMTRFFSSFIDHTLKEFEYVVRDKSTMEYLLDAEFDERRDIGYFYTDNGQSFERVLLCGNESSILFFELMIFLFVDILFYDYVLASAVSFFSLLMIEKIAVTACRRNLVTKAFIDQRFLI